MSDSDIIVEVSRRKLSKQVLYSPDTKVIGTVEAFSATNKLLYRSKSRTIVNGVTFSIPLLPKFASATLALSSVNGPVTTYIGACHLPKSACMDSDDDTDTGEPVEKTYKVLSESHGFVGKVRCLTYLQARWKPRHKQRKRRTGAPAIPAKDVPSRTEIPQGFRFRKIDKGVNWDRIRCLNLERVLMNNDTATLMSCIDDIALGNLEDEDVDPRLHHAMQLSQYSTQYLLGCQTLLNQRKQVIGEATLCFEKEEEELDMQIAKLRARNAALSREDDDLRDLQQQYTLLMEEICPGSVVPQQEPRKKKCQSGSEAEDRGGHARVLFREEAVEKYMSDRLSSLGDASVVPQSFTGPREPSADWSSARSHSQTQEALLHSGQGEKQLDQYLDGSRESPRHLQPEPHSTEADSGWTGVTSAQKPPIRRNVSREYVVSGNGGGSPGELPMKALSSTDVDVKNERHWSATGSSANCAEDWSKPKSVSNFAHTVDSAMDKTVGTNMSVDSLMNSNNFPGGMSTVTEALAQKNSGYFSAEASDISPIRERREVEGGDVNLGVTWSDRSEATSLSDLRSDLTAEGRQGSTYTHKEALPTQDMGHVAVTPASLSRTKSDQYRPTTGITSDKLNQTAPVSLSRVALTSTQEFSSDGKRSGREGGDSPAVIPGKALTDSRGVSSTFTDSAHCRDISSDVINDHDELFEHSGLQLSGSENESGEPNDPVNEDMQVVTNTDIQEFSFLSDVAEVSIHEQQQQFSARGSGCSGELGGGETMPSNDDLLSDANEIVKASETAPPSSQQSDMLLLDASNMSLEFPLDGSYPDVEDLAERTQRDVVDETESRSNFSSSELAGGHEARLPTAMGRNDRLDDRQCSPSVTINVHRNGDDEDEDDVLLGTTRFTATYTSRESESTYNDTNEYEVTEAGVTDGDDIGDKADSGEVNNSEDNPISVKFDDGNFSPAAIDDDDAIERTVSVTEKNSHHSSPAPSATNPVHWRSGRSPLDLIETANSLDVHVSAIRFDSSDYARIPKVYIQFEFLEVFSEVSPPITTNTRMSIMPLSFAAYMSFNRETCLILAEEISSQGEGLAVVIRFIEARDSDLGGDGNTETRVFADAIVELSVMIEDSCNINRQEIDIFDVEDNACIGSIVVDVRGRHLLARCS